MVYLVPILVNALVAGLAVAFVYLCGVAIGKPLTRQQVWDGALVLVLIAIAQEEIWLPRYSFNNRVGPTGLAIAATTLTALLQLLRRREPLLVLTATQQAGPPLRSASVRSAGCYGSVGTGWSGRSGS